MKRGVRSVEIAEVVLEGFELRPGEEDAFRLRLAREIERQLQEPAWGAPPAAEAADLSGAEACGAVAARIVERIRE